MKSFDYLWHMLDQHGVIERYKGEAATLWDSFTLEQQRQIYRSIRDNIRAGKFVNYNPVKAIRDNVPKKTQQEPTNFRGKAIPAGVQVFSAKYNGAWGMYTKADIERFHMERPK